MISIDGVSYNVNWVKNTLKRKAEIINGDNSGRLQGTKSMYLDYVGTFFNFSGQIIRGKGMTNAQWDSFFLLLSNPLNNHNVTLPFGQGTLTSEIYISSLEQTLIYQREENKWSSVIDVAFVTMDSQWLAGGTLQGYSGG